MTDHDDVVDMVYRTVDTAPASDEQIAVIAAAVRRRRMAWRIAAVVGVIAVLAAGVIVPWGTRLNRVDFVDTPAAPADEAAWRELPPSPLDSRWGAFSAWNDEGLFIWGGYATVDGGEGLRGDGAGFWNGKWAALPDGPLAPRMRTNSAAGWIHSVPRDGADNGEYWIVGGTGGADGRTPLRDAAAFRPTGPRQGQWYELPAVPEPIAAGVSIADRMVVVAQDSGESRAVYQLAPGDRQWDKLEQSLPPVAPAAADNSDLHLVDVGGQLFVVGLGEMFMLPNGLSQGVGLEWERVAPPDGARTLGNVRGVVADFAQAIAQSARSRDTDSVLVLLSDGTWRYDVDTGEWSRIADGLRPDPPQPIPLAETVDGTVVAVDVVGGRVHALSDDGWMALPPLDSPRVGASVELVPDNVPKGGDLTADDPEKIDDNEFFDNLVVWGGMSSEQSGTAQGLRLPLRQNLDP